jgi:hypothetical protein
MIYYWASTPTSCILISYFLWDFLHKQCCHLKIEGFSFFLFFSVSQYEWIYFSCLLHWLVHWLLLCSWIFIVSFYQIKAISILSKFPKSFYCEDIWICWIILKWFFFLEAANLENYTDFSKIKPTLHSWNDHSVFFFSFTPKFDLLTVCWRLLYLCLSITLVFVFFQYVWF